MPPGGQRERDDHVAEQRVHGHRHVRQRLERRDGDGHLGVRRDERIEGGCAGRIVQVEGRSSRSGRSSAYAWPVERAGRPDGGRARRLAGRGRRRRGCRRRPRRRSRDDRGWRWAARSRKRRRGPRQRSATAACAASGGLPLGGSCGRQYGCASRRSGRDESTPSAPSWPRMRAVAPQTAGPADRDLARGHTRRTGCAMSRTSRSIDLDRRVRAGRRRAGPR